MKQFKMGKFGIGVLIYVGVLILAVGAALGVLGSFLASFERNQPDRAAAKYIDTLSADAVKDLIEGSLPDMGEFETADTLYASSLFAESGKFSYLKKVDEYTSQKPVYYISQGGVQVGKFSLSPDGKDSFGMTKWKANSGELFIGEILPDPVTYTVKVPAGTALTVNGKAAGEKYITEKAAIYSGKVYLGASDSESLRCDVYTLPPLRSEPKISAEIGGMPVTVAGDGTVFDAFETDAVSLKITAPSDSSVMLDGTKIPAKFFTVTDQRVSLGEFEKNADIDVPTLMHCRVLNRVSAEKVTATVSGKALDVRATDGGILAQYREDSLRSVEIVVPEGSEIKLNGIPLGERCLVGDGTFEMLAGLERFAGTVPKVYRVSGLFREPEVSVTANGTPLPVCRRYERGGVTHVEYYGVPSDALKSGAEKRVLDFANAYITYTCSGYAGVDANHATVMSFMLPGTETYKKLQKSKESFSWAENYTITDRILTSGDFIPTGENSFFCTVDYTANLKKYSYKTEQKGTFRLLMIKSGGVWLVGGLLTENK